MAEVARLYYVRDLTQQQIAERLGVSRFKVLRLLEQARSRRRRPVRDRRAGTRPRRPLAPSSRSVSGSTRRWSSRAEVARRGRALLPRLLRPRDVLGVAWGETLASLVKHLPRSPRPGARRADLRRDRGAGAGHRPDGGGARFAAWSGGRFHPLQAPAVADAARACAAPFARRRRSSTASRSRSSASARAPTAPGTCSSMSSTTTGASSPTNVRSRSRVAQLRRATVVAAAGGRQKRRAVPARCTRAYWTSSSPTPPARGTRCDDDGRRHRRARRNRQRDGRRVRGSRLHGARRRRRRPVPGASSGSTHSSARTGSAAGASATARSTTCTDEGWDTVLDANLKSVFLYAKPRSRCCAATAAARS